MIRSRGTGFTLLAVLAALLIPVLFQGPAGACGESWEDMIIGGRKVTSLERDFLQFMLQYIDTTCPSIRSKIYSRAIDRVTALVKAWDKMADKYRGHAPSWNEDPAKWDASIEQARQFFAKSLEHVRLHQLVRGHYNYLMGKSHIMSHFAGDKFFTVEFMLEDLNDVLKDISTAFVKDTREEAYIRLLSCQTKILYIRKLLLKRFDPGVVTPLLAKITDLGAKLNAVKTDDEHRAELSAAFRDYLQEYHRTRHMISLLLLSATVTGSQNQN